jgi:hypothetical protein
LHGTVVVKLTIGTDRVILQAESSLQGSTVVGFGLSEMRLKRLEEMDIRVRVLLIGRPYVHTIRFHYVLEGDGISYDDTRVAMQLPDEVTITASPRDRDHWPPPARSKKPSIG